MAPSATLDALLFRARAQELSDYERAHQAHSKVVADFAQMQSVSEMEEKVAGRACREALQMVAPGCYNTVFVKKGDIQ